MAAKPTLLITGVSGNLGLRLLEQLADFQVIGLDSRKLPATAGVFRFERVDLAEERSVVQMLELMRAYRPEAVAHLAFILDSRSAAAAPGAVWQANVVGTSRVLEAIAEHNRTVGGIEKYVFSSGASVYGSEPNNPVAENAPLNAQELLSALHQQEADITVQTRAATLRKCKTYVLRSQPYAGPKARNYQLDVLRGTPGCKGALGARLRRNGVRLPLFLPQRGDYMEHRFQFVHIDDVARLIAHIVRRKEADPRFNVLNVAGRGDALPLGRCIGIAKIPVKQVPLRSMCRAALRLRWTLGISDVPPTALPYLLGSCVLETAKLGVFLGEHYRSVIRYSSEDALLDSFAPARLASFATASGSRV